MKNAIADKRRMIAAKYWSAVVFILFSIGESFIYFPPAENPSSVEQSKSVTGRHIGDDHVRRICGRQEAEPLTTALMILICFGNKRVDRVRKAISGIFRLS